MCSRCVGKKDEGKRGNMSAINTISFIPYVLYCLYTAVHENLHTKQHLPLNFFEFLDIETLVPANVNKHLHASIELEQ